jgi:uncharacterized membrane protein YdjX (TVP38/TMEM64 family)
MRISKPIVRWVGFALLLVALIIVSRFLPLRHWLVSFTEWAETAGVTGKLLFAGANVVGIVLCLWGTPFTLAAGVAFGLFWGVIIAWLSAGVGISVPFLISRYMARDAIAKRIESNLKFKAIDTAVRKKGGRIVVLLRLDPLIPFNVSNYVFGLTGISYKAYILASMAAMLPGTILYVYLGHVGRIALLEGGGALGPFHYVVMAGGLVFTIVVVLYITRLARRALASAQKAGKDPENSI